MEPRKPCRIFHITDVHLCECDERDPELLGYMKSRKKAFGEDLEKNFAELLKTAEREKVDWVMLTGDLLDMPTMANLDLLRKKLKGFQKPWSFTLGNHEWSSKSRLEWRKKIESVLKVSLGFQKIELPGLTCVLLDNSDYQIESGSLARLFEVEKGSENLMVFMHIPLSLPGLRVKTLEKWKTPILVADPDWSGESRKAWGNVEKDTDATLEFKDWVFSSKKLRAIYAGHLHLDHQEEVRRGVFQFVTDAGFKGQSRLIEVERD